MAIDIIPRALRERYRFEERNHACGILASDFPSEWQDLLDCLDQFWLHSSWITVGGGGRSQIPREIDGFLVARGWTEKQFDVRIVVDGREYPTPTHKIDNVKSRVGVEVEWNNKTEFYDRITRVSELQALFDELHIGRKYGASTTHWDKLIPKVDGGGAGGCPLLLVGITRECYVAE